MGDITKISRANDLRNIGDAKARADIADSFDTTANYNIGEMVLYDGLLYRFTAQHAAGAWNSSHVMAASLAEMVKKELLWHNTGTTYANTSINITGALGDFLLIEYITSAYSSLFREAKIVVIGEPFFLNTIIIPGTDPSQTVFYGREFGWSGTTLTVRYGSSRSIDGSNGKNLTTACVPINIYSLSL